MEISVNGRLFKLVRAENAADARALTDWTDFGMTGDYFIRRGHMKNLVGNPNSDVWAVVEDGGIICGFVCVYKDSTLHNLHLAPHVRGLGLGAEIIRVLGPVAVRCKRDMLAGDPKGFYEAQGYVTVGPDPRRPNIEVMAKPEAVEKEKEVLDKKTAAAERAREYRERRRLEREAFLAWLREQKQAKVSE